MKSLLAFVALGVGALLLTSGAQAASYSYDFNTDQSASFTVVEYLGPDSAINWTYDYSTHVQDSAFTDVPIPSAPNSGDSSTIGVRLDVNITTPEEANSLTLFPNAVGAPITGDWTMTFDVWANHNGNANGDYGSTEFFGFGAQDDALNPGVGSDGDNGFNYILTGDGGSSNDARYSFGTGTMATDNNIPAWFGTSTPPNNNFNFDADWLAFFPNDGTLGTAPSGTVNAGTPGKQWVTVRLKVTNSGADREVAFKRSADADFTVVSTITGGTGSHAQPCIGYADFFASTATYPNDQFVVFDNLVIDIPPAETADWYLF